MVILLPMVWKVLFGSDNLLDESPFLFFIIVSTVKPVLSGHSNIDKTKVLTTNGSLMKVESFAECSHWSILQYF